jgi:hypothetical protein
MFGRRPPIFVAFDVLVARGEDVRTLPLARRQVVLRRLARGARRSIAIADGVPGQGRRLFELVAEMDLEGIVAKRLADPYAPGRTTWFKILNRSYSQMDGRSERSSRADSARRCNHQSTVPSRSSAPVVVPVTAFFVPTMAAGGIECSRGSLNERLLLCLRSSAAECCRLLNERLVTTFPKSGAIVGATASVTAVAGTKPSRHCAT